jgi:phosphoribosylformylglycinamidine cyclo-ligase
VCITSLRTYAEAGVDVARVSQIQKGIETALSKTFQTRKGKLGCVLGIRGHYAALIEISEDYALALHTDNVGTKLLVAEACRKYDTIGIDCVAMNVNDIICVGAEPLAMVDYLALEKPKPRLVAEIMKGLQKGAREAGVAIVGGETAIVPDLVRRFDLSGTVVGIVRKDRIITGERAEPGDVVLGLASNGIHSNGLTLARKTLLVPRANPEILSELIRPTRIYVKEISRLLKSNLEIHGLAHITGGAYSKLKRIGQRAKVGFQLDNLPDPPWVFRAIQSKARVSDREMYRTFNMGTGFLVICPRQTAKRARNLVPRFRQVGQVTSSREVTVKVKTQEFSVTKY